MLLFEFCTQEKQCTMKRVNYYQGKFVLNFLLKFALFYTALAAVARTGVDINTLVIWWDSMTGGRAKLR